MEMDKVPQAGYEIIGLWIGGLQRRITLENLLLPFKIIHSLVKSNKILREFKPDAVIGFGGYASMPILYSAVRKKIPSMIQEQNSYAGIANRMMGKKVQKVCVAYEGMEKYFSGKKTVLTGNPVRKDILDVERKRPDGLEYFALVPEKKTILVLGGSLGARTINESIVLNIPKIINSRVQMIWQTGKLYFEEMNKRTSSIKKESIKLHKFLDRMDLAYAVADVVISRAGALTISELSLVKKPVIFVPSPNVAEDHQTKNASYLVNRNAALMVKDKDAIMKLVDEALELLDNTEKQLELKDNIGNLGKPNAAERIVNELLDILE